MGRILLYTLGSRTVFNFKTVRGDQDMVGAPSLLYGTSNVVNVRSGFDDIHKGLSDVTELAPTTRKPFDGGLDNLHVHRLCFLGTRSRK